ncbi:MAG TPA: pyruvate dehydrogenase (acetyl-transferring), homodimeric type [Ilumatobacteraceae bacterium]|nr:pyruvate dehydrogenase (acetyl-transferring), homodimeric type [Ilumatobacteraceae bacterium]
MINASPDTAFTAQFPDPDPGETREWLDSLSAVVSRQGSRRARYLISQLLQEAPRLGIEFPGFVTSDYVNTIPASAEPAYPGDEQLEHRIRRIIRWNAAAMVARANHRFDGLGGHLATYASAASLYEVGFNHFFRGRGDGRTGDQVFFQGHASPGIYSRAYLEGHLDEAHLDSYRRETGGRGLASYPHPRRMPDFWEFPTVSMGLGVIDAIYQARFNRYLANRGITDTSNSRVWSFPGDGEMDEPESLAGLSIAGREQLDNLVMVVNCNLQRLDGPVRGNGKIIQELEARFRAAGWNVIKVVWGREWDALLAADSDGVLIDKMNTTLDGQYQKYAVESGAFIRERFFGTDPRLAELVAHLGDDQIRRLRVGGHDHAKLHAAYSAAIEHRGAPTAILARTVKGWALGPDFEARNAAHQMKTMSVAELKTFRDRLELDISDAELDDDLPPYHHPGEDSVEVQYLRERRRELGGPIPRRMTTATPLPRPSASKDPFAPLLVGSGDKITASTTSAFTRLLRDLMRDSEIGNRIVPIIPDEGRTFGMEPLFAKAHIYSPTGQLYEPVDAGMLLSYRQATDGQVLEEGICEAAAMASFTAAGTAYATWGTQMVPFYVFYSMFGFQRVGDAIWQFGDARGRGFLIGATAGRTTLLGEGLQHCDGHSPLLASVVPNCRAYDPAFAYEVAVIIRDGLTRMTGPDAEDVFYYLNVYNESLPQPPMPDGVEGGIVDGLYRYREATNAPAVARLVASGSAMAAALEAQRLLAGDHGVAAEVWSAPSWKLLRENALRADRWNILHPEQPPQVPLVRRLFGSSDAPVVAVTDYIRAVPHQIAPWISAPFVVLGTDGFGLSDTREGLRNYFGIDAPHIVVATLSALAATGTVSRADVAAAIARYAIDPDALDPTSV